MRTPIDWRELIASNRTAIERGGLGPVVPGRPPVRVHVPRDLDRGTPAPLVLMLHGCGQDAEGFAAATRMDATADRHGFVVAYPQQSRGANAGGCWNWFEPAHQGRGAGEPAALAGAVAELARAGSHSTVDARRVYAAGLSAGGAMAAILAAAYPDVFAAVAVHSGLAPRAASTLAGAFAAMARGAEGPPPADAGVRTRVVPSIVIHGDADRTVAPVNARQALAAAMAANRRASPDAAGLDPGRPSAVAHGHVPAGHAYTLRRWTDRRGTLVHALLTVDAMGHAWSGGTPGAAHADPSGPDASEAIWRFFAAASAREAARDRVHAGTASDDADRP